MKWFILLLSLFFSAFAVYPAIAQDQEISMIDINKTVEQLQNHSTNPIGYLAEIEVQETTDPVVSLYRESTGDLVYSLRIKGNQFKPFVYVEDSYKVVVTQPDLNLRQEIEGMRVGDESVKRIQLNRE